MSSDVTRVLVVHPEAATRQAVESAVRAASRGAASIYRAASLGAGLESARRLAPHAVFLDVGTERELALELARGLRGAGRVLIGLYNPLVQSADDAEFLREAARAGIADFVPLPVSEAEVGEVLAAALGRRGGPAEGRVVTFFGHKGGAGRTTLAVNTALVLAAGELMRGEVALCDGSLQLGDAAGVEHRVSLHADRDRLHPRAHVGDGGVVHVTAARVVVGDALPLVLFRRGHDDHAPA